MKIAVISDIHSNCFALKEVLAEIDKSEIDKIFILGDIFGYYPWAVATYKLLTPYLFKSIVIKGNHDQLILDKIPPNPIPSYWEAAKKNETELANNCIDAIKWLRNLNFSDSFFLDNCNFELYHGTPDNPENGRFYPTNLKDKNNWYPQENTFIFLGHTHYPINSSIQKNVFNPGSVGQPRDGIALPSWGVFDTKSWEFFVKRTPYNNKETIQKLQAMQWNKRAIAAISKTSTGNLKF